MTKRRLRGAAALVAAAVTLTACGSANPGGARDASLRSRISAGLKAQGDTAEAQIAAASGTEVTPVPAAFLGRWRIYRVDGNEPHTVQFSVGVGPGDVLLLTDRPAAFGSMADAAGTRVRDTAGAVSLARVYLRTTRPTDVLSYTVDGVRQIHFRPGLTGADAARRDAIVRRYRTVVTAPHADRRRSGFVVTAYTVRDRALQRRTLSVGTNGAVTDHAKSLVTDLPVPYTM